MTKKSCYNCRNYSFFNGSCIGKETFSHEDFKCKDWQRNPKLWLDIPPEEEGWYWWRSEGKNVLMVMLTMWSSVDKTVNVFDGNQCVPVTDFGGQWQGPIKPEG
jgi:hypothetical protein